MWVVYIVRLVIQGRECLVAQREKERKCQGSVSRGCKETIFLG